MNGNYETSGNKLPIHWPWACSATSHLTPHFAFQSKQKSMKISPNAHLSSRNGMCSRKLMAQKFCQLKKLFYWLSQGKNRRAYMCENERSIHPNSKTISIFRWIDQTNEQRKKSSAHSLFCARKKINESTICNSYVFIVNGEYFIAIYRPHTNT